MTSFSLQRRLKDTGITVSSLHPGVVSLTPTTCLLLLFISRCLCVLQIKSELWRNMAESSNFAFKLFAKIGPCESCYGVLSGGLTPPTAVCSPLPADFMRGVKDGAATTINCAVNPQLNSGQCFYYSDCAPKQPIAIARFYNTFKPPCPFITC